MERDEGWGLLGFVLLALVAVPLFIIAAVDRCRRLLPAPVRVRVHEE